MNIDTINTLKIPQEATELTTSDLKLICGGWEGNNNCNNDDNDDHDYRRPRHWRKRHRCHNQCDE